MISNKIFLSLSSQAHGHELYNNIIKCNLIQGTIDCLKNCLFAWTDVFQLNVNNCLEKLSVFYVYFIKKN